MKESKNEYRHLSILKSLSSHNDNWGFFIPRNKAVTKSIKETLNNYNSIAIYGIGYFGKRLVKLLETEGIIIKFLIDQKVREYLDYDVFNPSVKIPHVDFIIITNCMDVEEIKNNINADSNTKIQSISELLKDNNY